MKATVYTVVEKHVRAYRRKMKFVQNTSEDPGIPEGVVTWWLMRGLWKKREMGSPQVTY